VAEQEPGAQPGPSPITELTSALTGKTTEAMDAARSLERMAAAEIIAEVSNEGGLEGLQRLVLTVNDTLAAVAEGLRHFADRAGQEYELWHESRRFRPEVVEQALAELRDRAEQDPVAAETAWAVQVVEALDRHEYGAATQLIEGYPDEDATAALLLKSLRGDVRLWADGDAQAAVRVCGKLGEALAGYVSLPAQTQARLVMLAATADQQAGRSDDAVRILDDALETLPAATVLEAERAGLSLVRGQHDDAAQRALLAVERTASRADGYFHLGACNERDGDLTEAAELYEEGCARATLLTLTRVGTGATFLRVTGLLHFTRARRLAELGHPQEALDAADDALREGVAGDVLYSNAPVHELRVILLTDIGRQEEAAAAALKAGQQHLRNGDVARALPLLEKAWSIEPPISEAGWYYADALRAASWPPSSPSPDADRVERAVQVWADRAARFGPPQSDDAWAYGVRALLSELAAQAAEGALGAAAWEALTYIEKALVLNQADARLWGWHSRFLSRLSMNSAAMESADRGFTLDPDDRTVLRLRLRLLVNAGRYADAEETLDRLPSRDTEPYLVAVRAKLLYHRAQYEEAVRAFELPLAEGYDPGWCLEHRASCFVRLSKPAAARADLERLLEVEVYQGPVSTLRRAAALIELGRLDAASRELDQLKAHDDRISPVDLTAVWVAMYLARGDLAAARVAGEQYIRGAGSVSDVQDTLNNWREYLYLLADQGTDITAATQVVDELAEWREAKEQPPPRPDADREIEHAGREHAPEPPGSNPRIALAAMTARRLLGDGGDPERAEVILRGLVGTPFDPEADIAVTAVLQQRLTLAVSRGDEIQARQIYEELADRGAAPASTVEVVIADALAAAGEYRKAISALAAARIRLLDEGRPFKCVDVRIGEYALRVGDADMSLAAFGRALENARAADDWLAQAQIQVRMATALALRGERDSVTEHLTLAFRALDRGGVVAPSSTLAHELAAVAETLGASPALGLLSESLRRAVDRVDPPDQADREFLDAMITAAPPGPVARPRRGERDNLHAPRAAILRVLVGGAS
jgi:tetratricopeptide (TPR) repeat protein